MYTQDFAEYEDTYEESPPRITVIIAHASDAESPLDYMDDLKMHSFHRRDGNAHPDDFFTHTDAYGNEIDGPTIGLRRKLDCGTAVILSCYQHGGVSWSLQGEGMRCRFDTADVAGMLIWEGKPNEIGKTYEERMAFFRSVLGEYNEWANGSVHWYRIEDTLGEIEDSCGGMYHDHLISELESILSDIDPDDVVFEGDGKWIGDYITVGKSIKEK